MQGRDIYEEVSVATLFQVTGEDHHFIEK